MKLERFIGGEESPVEWRAGTGAFFLKKKVEF